MVAENFSTIENIHVKINTMRATELGILWPCVPVISAHVQDDLRYIIVCNLTSIWYIVARFCHCALKSKKVHKVTKTSYLVERKNSFLNSLTRCIFFFLIKILIIVKKILQIARPYYTYGCWAQLDWGVLLLLSIF